MNVKVWWRCWRGGHQPVTPLEIVDVVHLEDGAVVVIAQMRCRCGLRTYSTMAADFAGST